MSSDSPVVTTVSARALASRINGARSRGPKTAAGKARASRNALKRGLCVTKLVVFPEDAAEFRALEAALLAELAPAARRPVGRRNGVGPRSPTRPATPNPAANRPRCSTSGATPTPTSASP